MTGISGSPPDLRHPPSGCPFHPRCQYAMDLCAQQVPALEPPAGPRPGLAPHPEAGRTVACWLHDPGSPVPVPPELSLVPGAAAVRGLAAVPRLTAIDSSGGTP